MATAMSEVYDESTHCTVCFLAYDTRDRKPKFLSCHHTFCLQCMKSFDRKQVESIPCPTCRKETPCEIGQEEGLATNNYLSISVTSFKIASIPGFTASNSARSCLKCGEDGHVPRDCPLGSVGDRRAYCYKCGEEGHSPRECPLGVGAVRGRACYNCGKEGHMARQCPANIPLIACLKCGEVGHFARECPFNISAGRSRKYCYNCGIEGHKARECPDICDNCRQLGHMARECPQSCSKCGELEHVARECPQDEGPRLRPTHPLLFGDYESRQARATSANGEEDIEEWTNLVVPPEQNSAPSDIAVIIENASEMTITRSQTFKFFEKAPLQVRGRAVPKRTASFESANLNTRLLRKIQQCGFIKPTLVQERAVPAILARRDVLVCAEPQSGKTVGYLIPIIDVLLEKNVRRSSTVRKPVVLIIVPDVQSSMSNRHRVQNLLEDGSVENHQIQIITVRQMRSIINGMHLSDFSKIEFLILDDALPVESDFEKLLSHPSMPPPGDRQTLIFSSTFPNDVQQLAMKYLRNDYILIADNWTLDGVNPHLNLVLRKVTWGSRLGELENVLQLNSCGKTIIFLESDSTVDSLAYYLDSYDFSATRIHEKLSQHQQNKALLDFKNNEKFILVCTYAVADHLDLTGVEFVFYYELGSDVEDYVFRNRRSGRRPIIRHILFFDADNESEEKTGKLVSKLSACGADIPDFLFQATNAGPGMIFNHPPSQSAEGERRYPVWKLSSIN